jgi:hypothetical protein
VPRIGDIRNTYSYLARRALKNVYLEYRKDGDVNFQKDLRTKILGEGKVDGIRSGLFPIASSNISCKEIS